MKKPNKLIKTTVSFQILALCFFSPGGDILFAARILGTGNLASTFQTIEIQSLDKRWIPLEELEGILDYYPDIEEIAGLFLIQPKTGRIKFAKRKTFLKYHFKLWVMRHGQTQANVEGELQGEADEKKHQLNDQGREEAERAANDVISNLEGTIRERGIVVASSHLGRAIETAKVALKKIQARKLKPEMGEEPHKFKLANEMNYGSLQKKKKTDLRGSDEAAFKALRFGKNVLSRMPGEGGESFIDVMIRAKKLLDMFDGEYSNETVLLSSHGMFINATRVLLGDEGLLNHDGYIDPWSEKTLLSNGEVRNIYSPMDNLIRIVSSEMDEEDFERLIQLYKKELLDGHYLSSFLEEIKKRIENDDENIDSMRFFLWRLWNWMKDREGESLSGSLGRVEKLLAYDLYLHDRDLFFQEPLPDLNEKLKKFRINDPSKRHREDFDFLWNLIRSRYQPNLPYGGLTPQDRYVIAQEMKRLKAAEIVNSPLFNDFEELRDAKSPFLIQRGERFIPPAKEVQAAMAMWNFNVEEATDYVIERRNDHFDDPSILTGTANFIDPQGTTKKVMVIGIQRGSTIDEMRERNGGLSYPRGYWKVIRAMRYAEKGDLPIITFIDTPGADNSLASEINNQASTISYTLQVQEQLNVPVIHFVTGLSGSAGGMTALRSGPTHMLENGQLLAVNPGASILITKIRNALETIGIETKGLSDEEVEMLWEDQGIKLKRKEYEKVKADALQADAERATERELLDGTIQEFPGGFHRFPMGSLLQIRRIIKESLDENGHKLGVEIREERYERFRSHGSTEGEHFITEGEERERTKSEDEGILGIQDRLEQLVDRRPDGSLAINELSPNFEDKEFLGYDAAIHAVYERHPEDDLERRLEEAKERTGSGSGVFTGYVSIDGIVTMLIIKDPRWANSSDKSIAIGEKVTRALEDVYKKAKRGEKIPVLSITTGSGGRQQEGARVLGSLHKKVFILSKLSRLNVPIMSVSAYNVYGGDSASDASFKDAYLVAIKGTQIGFTGARVVLSGPEKIRRSRFKLTPLKKKLPSAYQTSRFSLGHGYIDGVIPPNDLREVAVAYLDHVTGRSDLDVRRTKGSELFQEIHEKRSNRVKAFEDREVLPFDGKSYKNYQPLVVDIPADSRYNSRGTLSDIYLYLATLYLRQATTRKNESERFTNLHLERALEAIQYVDELLLNSESLPYYEEFFAVFERTRQELRAVKGFRPRSLARIQTLLEKIEGRSSFYKRDDTVIPDFPDQDYLDERLIRSRSLMGEVLSLAERVENDEPNKLEEKLLLASA